MTSLEAGTLQCWLVLCWLGSIGSLLFFCPLRCLARSDLALLLATRQPLQAGGRAGPVLDSASVQVRLRAQMHWIRSPAALRMS